MMAYWKCKVKKHERIKIFNEKGLEEANIKINYLTRNNMELVTKLEAQTYNLDNNGNIIITKLDKKSVYNKKVNNRYPINYLLCRRLKQDR